MTEKRFQYNVNKNTIEQDGKFVAYMNSVDGVRIANKLNVFQKENEQLKEERNYFERKKCEYFNKYNKKHLDNIQLKEENEQLKKELKKYTDAFDCGQCRFQNYDWFDDGDEFEVCEKGNNEAQMENHSCSEWEEI